MKNFEKKRVLVTGGTGFIGKRLIEALIKENAIVYCLSRDREGFIGGVNYVRCDLSQTDDGLYKDIRQRIQNVDYLFLLAASIPLLGDKKESLVESANNTLNPTINSLQNLGSLSETIVYTSTIDVYGRELPPNFDEDQKIDPVTNYAISKLAGEGFVKYYSRKNNKSFSILRLSQVYGPYEPVVRVVPIIWKAILNDRKFVLSGGGKDKRRFLFVDDAVSALLLAALKAENEIYNVAGQQDTSIREVIDLAQRISSKELILEEIDKDRSPSHSLPSSEKIRKNLGYADKHTFGEGMEIMYQWLKNEKQ